MPEKECTNNSKFCSIILTNLVSFIAQNDNKNDVFAMYTDMQNKPIALPFIVHACTIIYSNQANSISHNILFSLNHVHYLSCSK